MAPTEYLEAWGTLIHEKNLKSKISCQTPFNVSFYFDLEFFKTFSRLKQKNLSYLLILGRTVCIEILRPVGLFEKKSADGYASRPLNPLGAPKPPPPSFGHKCRYCSHIFWRKVYRKRGGLVHNHLQAVLPRMMGSEAFLW